MRPHRTLRMCGSDARVTYSTVIRFDEKIPFQSSSELSSTVPHRKSPTLFTTTSSRPKRSTTVLTSCSARDGSEISVSTATPSTPLACSCRNVNCAAALFERYAMATRAPSFASRVAIPRPIPRLPPVTSATRFRSDIPLPTPSISKACQYSPAAYRLLPHPRHDHRHIIRLVRASRPFFRGGHQRFRHAARSRALHPHRRFQQPPYPELFSIYVFRFHQSVAVAHQQRITRDRQRIFFVGRLFINSQHHPALVHSVHSVLTQQKRRQMPRVGIPHRPRRAVIHRNEKRRETVVRGIAHQMFVQPRHQFVRPQHFAATHQQLAAQRRLQTGHQQRRRNSLSRNIRDGHGDVRRRQLYEIVVIAAHRA